MNQEPNCKQNGHGFDDMGVCIYCGEFKNVNDVSQQDETADVLIYQLYRKTVFSGDTSNPITISVEDFEKEFKRIALTAITEAHKKSVAEIEEGLLFDLDEIDNKPWRVFRQLAKIMPEYSDEYSRYERFYANGGGQKVARLIQEFEDEETRPGGY